MVLLSGCSLSNMLFHLCQPFWYFLGRKKKREVNTIIWLLIACLSFLIAGEEISWGERLTGIGIDSISNINVQGETNFHNLPFFHNYLLDPVFEISCIFLGWFGWRKFKKINALPAKEFSLFFLSVALFYFYFDISWASTTEQIRNDQEIFEFLLSSGVFLHCLKNFNTKVYNLLKIQYQLCRENLLEIFQPINLDFAIKFKS